MTWEATWLPPDGPGLPARDVQVIPLDDLRPHLLRGCWCAPREDDAGVLIHNSADGREAFETGARKPS